MITTAAELVLTRAGDEAVGLSFEGRDWTWAEVVAEALSRAGWLTTMMGEGPRHAGVLLENTQEYVFLLAGAALAGVTVVGLNPTRRGEELARDIRHTDCQILMTDPAGLRLVDGLDLGATTKRVIDSTSATYLRDLAGHRGKPVPENLPAPTDIFVLIFTSGSTGHPKAVKVSHGRAARSAAGIPFGPDDVLYSAMPLFHGNALFSSVLPAFLAGSRIVLRRRFSASGFLDDIRAGGCTFFNTVGRAIAHINATPPSSFDRDHRLKWVLGPETSEPDKAAFTARFGPPVFDGYGSSENAVILHPAPRGVGRRGSLGVAPPGSDIAVVDAATGEERPAAQFDSDGVLVNAEAAIGELVGRNALERFEGYYNDPEAEAERRRGGWYCSGDLAYRDAEGVFYFAGRGGDWMRVDSENFTAAPIERILARAPGVAGVAVYPVPDARTADQVMAAIEVVGGPAAFDPATFSAWMADQPDLSLKWVPTYLRVVASLPVTGTDKLDKKPLRAERWRTSDPLWRRLPRTMDFVPMGADDVADLERQFAANGRANLLT